MARSADTETAVDNVPGSLLERLEEFERRRGNGQLPSAPHGSQPLTTDPEVDVVPILPDGWRSGEGRRRRRRKRRRRTERTLWRRARWSVLLTAILAGVVAAALLVWVPQYAETLADDVVGDYATALAEVDAALPGVPPVLEEIAAPAVPGDDLADRILPFGRFRAATTSLSSVARASLPEVPPLFPDDPVAELAPVRERLSLVAGRADVLAGRIAKFVVYRTALTEAFVLPPLPTIVQPAEVNDLSLALAQMLADSLDAVTRMPSDPLLDAHRAEVQIALEWLRTWEIDYLEALRADDPGAAQALVNQARARITRLRAGLDEPLAEFRLWAEQELDGLDRDLDAAQLLVARAG